MTALLAHEVAEAFAAMLKAGRHREAGEAWNAPDIVSIEPHDGPAARMEVLHARHA